jgi:hypothetical protein
VELTGPRSRGLIAAVALLAALAVAIRLGDPTWVPVSAVALVAGGLVGLGLERRGTMVPRAAGWWGLAAGIAITLAVGARGLLGTWFPGRPWIPALAVTVVAAAAGGGRTRGSRALLGLSALAVAPAAGTDRVAVLLVALAWFVTLAAALWSLAGDRDRAVPVAGPDPVPQRAGAAGRWDLVRVPALALGLGVLGALTIGGARPGIGPPGGRPPPVPPALTRLAGAVGALDDGVAVLTGQSLTGQSVTGQSVTGQSLPAGGAGGSGTGSPLTSPAAPGTGSDRPDALAPGAIPDTGANGATGTVDPPGAVGDLLELDPGAPGSRGIGNPGTGTGTAAGDPTDGAATGVAAARPGSRPAPESPPPGGRPLLAVGLGLLALIVAVAVTVALWPPAAGGSGPGAGPAWARDLLARLESEGARRGRPRRPTDSVAGYSRDLAGGVLPDPRVGDLGAALSGALFGPGDPPAGPWPLLLDDICAAHPAPPRWRRTGPHGRERSTGEGYGCVP